MGILLDVVPNHMGINDPANLWWLDVLEHGEAADHAAYFDIDWQPSAAHLQHKVLLPFLGAPFGEVLESGQLQLVVRGRARPTCLSRQALSPQRGNVARRVDRTPRKEAAQPRGDRARP